MSILVADIGSTKGHWAWLAPARQATFMTRGYNPIQHQDEELTAMLSEVSALLPGPVDEVFCYGSGLASVSHFGALVASLRSDLDMRNVTCESDMLGAARALSPDVAAVICILGTGSNSCVFDGQRIGEQIPSLGFPLGDEGGGADIGRQCVRAFYYGIMPEEVRKAFVSVLPEDRLEFIQQYKSHPTPNALLGSLVHRLAPFVETDFARSVLQDSFRTFARLHIKPYHADLPVHVVGGIAATFENIWRAVLKEEGCQIGKVERTSLPGLIAFHSTK